MLYDNEASGKAQSAMMREIAVKAGNFRGVCPFNRAAERVLYMAYIAGCSKNRPVYAPVFSRPGVIRTKACARRLLTVRSEGQGKLNFV